MSQGADDEWGTVERLDGPLQGTDVLEVPELDDNALQAMEAAEATREEETQTPSQRGEPGSQVECDVCGRTVRVRKDGELFAHRCEAKAQRGNRFEHLPDRRSTAPKKVREFGITVLAWAVEEGSAHAIARPFGADPDDVPTELPDAEGMIGPPLDLLWPSIPDSAQRFIAACADNSDLIACALAWGDWMRTISRYARDQRAYNQRLTNERQAHGANVATGTNGYVGGSVVPFSPA